MCSSEVALQPNLSASGNVRQEGSSWRLEIPAGEAGAYRLAQLDDYTRLERRSFRWQPPLHLLLEARASSPEIAGTWGFGLWNDPFSVSLGLGGGIRRFPALPQAIWFFFASPPNYLSFRDDLPAQGFLAATFQSRRLPATLLALAGALAAPLLPAMLWRPAAQRLRRLARRFIHQDAAPVSIDPTSWHSYELTWDEGCATLGVDGSIVLATTTAPHPPLGLVLWIDNQFAALPPDSRPGYGTLATPAPAWIELRELILSHPFST